MKMGENIHKKAKDVEKKILRILDKMDRGMMSEPPVLPTSGELEDLIKLQQEFNELMQPFNDRLWP